MESGKAIGPAASMIVSGKSKGPAASMVVSPGPGSLSHSKTISGGGTSVAISKTGVSAFVSSANVNNNLTTATITSQVEVERPDKLGDLFSERMEIED